MSDRAAVIRTGNPSPDSGPIAGRPQTGTRFA